MGVLNNPKWERFAQELAKGKTATEAYKTAGYKPSRFHTSSLKQKSHIAERVAELLADRDKAHVKATAKAMEELAIDREWVMARLMEQYSKAAAIPNAPAAVTAALRALELLGREIGMFIERHEVGAAGDFARMSDDELRHVALVALGHGAPEGGKPN